MSYSVPLLGGGEAAKSRSILTKYQGYVQANGAVVEFNLSGVFVGYLPWDKAMKIARKGLVDSENCLKDGSLVKLHIKGHFDGAGPPEQMQHMFRKMLRAAENAREHHLKLMRVFQTPRGGRRVFGI